MDTWYKLSLGHITYGQLLDKISQYEVGEEFDVDQLEYSSYIFLFIEAEKNGYILRLKTDDTFAPSTYRFLVKRKPSKNYEEGVINSYFG